MLRHILERKLDKSTIEHLNFQWGPTLPVTRRSDPLNPRSPVTNDSRRRMGERLCQLRQASENFGLKVSSKPARESCFVCRLSWLWTHNQYKMFIDWDITALQFLVILVAIQIHSILHEMMWDGCERKAKIQESNSCTSVHICRNILEQWSPAPLLEPHNQLKTRSPLCRCHEQNLRATEDRMYCRFVQTVEIMYIYIIYIHYKIIYINLNNPQQNGPRRFCAGETPLPLPLPFFPLRPLPLRKPGRRDRAPSALAQGGWFPQQWEVFEKGCR